MTQLAAELKYRIQIWKPVQSNNDDGGFDRSYDTLLTIWAGCKPIKYSTYIRYSNVEVEEDGTHVFKIRRCAVITLGTSFSTGFSTGFKSIRSLMPLTTEYFIFMQQSSSNRGRLFRIKGVQDNNEEREFYRVLVEEIEERGTGYPN